VSAAIGSSVRIRCSRSKSPASARASNRPSKERSATRVGCTILEFRQRLAPSWEAIAAASYTDVLGRQTHEWALGPVWHINRIFALGAFYRRNGGSNGFDLTLRTYY
jgi:hypothetical protein